MIMLIRTKTIM